MGMAAIIVMWPGPFEQFFVPPTHWGYIWNLVTIGPTVSEEKSFETSSWADIIFVIKVQVTLKWNITSGLNSNWSKILYLSWIPASLKKLWSKLKAGQHFPHYNSMGKTFVAQGLVTLQKIIRPDTNSNWYEILCLSWLPANLKMLRSKLKALWSGQKFPLYNLMRKIFVAQGQNNPTWPKFELVRDFMPVLDTCKLKEVTIKTHVSMGRTTFSPL